MARAPARASLSSTRSTGRREMEDGAMTSTAHEENRTAELGAASLDPVVGAFFEAVDDHDWDGLRAILADGGRCTMPDADVEGADAVVEYLQRMAGVFPDGRHSVETALSVGDTVATEGVWTGSHGGPLPTPMGEVPATGRRLAISWAAFFTVRDGRVQAGRMYFDQLAFMVQLGLVPEPAAA